MDFLQKNRSVLVSNPAKFADGQLLVVELRIRYLLVKSAADEVGASGQFVQFYSHVALWLLLHFFAADRLDARLR